ncbi:MAG: DNA-3-methyladenine glycosylase [Methanobacterium sp.]|uniref:DNA-3-methyladenine glycosylase n=1 Tax=Methanobacterium sp. TaxID=2164 RepID=UPI003C70A423
MKLERSFYSRDTILVAKELLGCYLVHETPDGITKGKIVEVEAYKGPKDKGAHSYKYRHTPKMDPLYKNGGFAYVFQVYGNNYCFNVVTQNENMPEAVLIRALEPYEGIGLMGKRRNIDLSDDSKSKFKNLTNGPSKLCQAFDIKTSLNGVDLCGDELYILSDCSSENNREIVATPRINIDYAEEYKDRFWRFFLKGNVFISGNYRTNRDLRD